VNPGRNTPCPCGSGQKYKYCCGRLPTQISPPSHESESHSELAALAALLDAKRFADLEEQARIVLATHPLSGRVWQILGVALASQGKDSLQAALMAVHCLPDCAPAYLNLGNALARVGRSIEAEGHYQQALLLDPGLVQAHFNLGELYMERESFEQAATSFGRAIEIHPGFAPAHAGFGQACLRLGQYGKAEASCRRAIQLQPSSAAAHNSLGNVLSKLDPQEAIASYRTALALSPQFIEAWLNLANTLRGLGRLEEALHNYQSALAIDPNFAPAHIELATTLRLQGRTAECEAACHLALRIAPESAGALAVLAELRADVGRFSDAQELFQSAISKDPESVEAWAGLARIRRMTKADADWLSGVQNLVARGLPPRREMTLRYAIGKYFDDIKGFPEAFRNFQRANELARRSAPEHDRQRHQRSIDSIIHSHDAAWLQQQRRGVTPDRLTTRPVFIVGMLRSGTSLAEQILASHPAVFGAGELPFWSTELNSQLISAFARNSPLHTSDDRLTAASEAYLQLLNRFPSGAARVLDKMPTNYLALGLIHAVFPEARIIHMQRHPIDTCLSIYFQHFEAANAYTHDLEDLADYYRGYRRLMEHWRAVLPAGAILDVSYEQLVADTPRWTRAILEFLSLPWDPRCLEFQRTPRTVVTASKWQVRQPIDRGSVDRWRRYQQFLEPLLTLMPPTSV